MLPINVKIQLLHQLKEAVLRGSNETIKGVVRATFDHALKMQDPGSDERADQLFNEWWEPFEQRWLERKSLDQEDEATDADGDS